MEQVQAKPLPLAITEAMQLAEGWEGLPGERKMVASLLRWLVAMRWLGSASHVAFEVPWRGRRIDLVTTNSKGQISTFEFKLGGTGRVFEQALYNSISANRSLIVSGGMPSANYRELAEAHGLGVIVINGSVQLVQRPVLRKPDPELLKTLRARARK